MELTIGLERHCIDGSADRWKVVNCSDGINAEIVSISIDGDAATLYDYQLHVSGDELEDKVVIVRSTPPTPSHWHIFQIKQTASGLVIVPIALKPASLGPAIGGWFWTGGPEIFREINSGHNSKFRLNLSLHWGVALTLERNWTARQYWNAVHREANIEIEKMPFSPTENELTHILKVIYVCNKIIYLARQLAQLKVGRDQVAKIVRSIIGNDHRAENGVVLALMKSTDGPTASHGSRINEALHDICDAMSLKPGPSLTSRHKPRVQRQRHPDDPGWPRGQRDNGQPGPF